ncbi:J domain-containing protein required for chloroplast accumulation response 1 isoform X1 [Phaseolus vulgaris]|uniref:J domain-containing protein required for chloroplast accumulation response 1 isoform X1 n=1 Tax=Phaseolus vulgaris TaxID=3885 RepID=UPI0035CA8762
METIYSSQRESVLLGYNNNISYENGNNSLIRRSSSTNSNLEVDFNDVFGGPPRRSSLSEARQSLTELKDWSEEEGESGWCRWPPEREKPVFGEDIGNRRRHGNKNNDFFDDIFGGEESASVCSTPKKRVGDPFTFSRVSSPLPSALDPVAASLPLPFSLPAKLTNGVDLPTFGSPTRTNSINNGIVASNGLGLSDSYSSRISIQQKELKKDLKPYRQSLLSQEFSNSSTSDKADKGSIMKQDISISEVSPASSNGQFHFSIYKWASKDVPMVMSLRTERASKAKDKLKLEKCSSAKERVVSEITTQKPMAYDSSVMNNGKENVSTTSTATENGADSNQIVEQIVSAKAQSHITLDVPASSTPGDARAVSSTHSAGENGFSGKTETGRDTQKVESKPLQFLFKENDKKQDNSQMITREKEENRMKSTKKLSAVFDVTENPMKQVEKTVSAIDVGHSKATSQGSVSLGENKGKGLVKGKVKEFARIFNQETATKPKVDSKSRPQGSTYKQRDALRTKNDQVESGPEQSKKENSTVETTNISADDMSNQEDMSESAEIPDISFTVIGDKDECFHGGFMIQVLSQDEGEDLQNQEIQMIDKKIKQWSKGKEGNIRSLLSTLQHVLWKECGWKHVPLVDIIEGNAVKRSYQRALLCLHPDKLQQKGASSDQKYIAEKVFDILQEAWTQFNMLGAL